MTCNWIPRCGCRAATLALFGGRKAALCPKLLRSLLRT
jgi:hypothetical protein